MLNILSSLEWKDDLLDTSSDYFKSMSFKVANEVDLPNFFVFVNELPCILENYLITKPHSYHLLLFQVNLNHFSHAKTGTQRMSIWGEEGGGGGGWGLTTDT